MAVGKKKAACVGEIWATYCDHRRKAMKSVKIMFRGINDVRSFVSVAEKYEFEIDIVLDRYRVNGKSIMGIFSLDLSSELELVIHSDDCAAFLAEIKTYIVA